ncbi:unc-8, partial [Pristionchus pacificus]
LDPFVPSRTKEVPSREMGKNEGELITPTVGYVNISADDDEDYSNLFSDRKVSSRKSERLSHQDKNQSLKTLFRDFCNRTSSHGIPFFRGDSYFGRFTWMAIFLCCLSFFIFQTYWTMSEYLDYRTIIEMQLKFEPAPFPAATVCNLNPFKYSELRQHESIQETFEIYERVIEQSDRLQSPLDFSSKKASSREIDIEIEKIIESEKKMKRKVQKTQKRQRRQAEYHAVFAKCTCMPESDQCVPNRNPLQVNATVCVCFEDSTTGDVWPCYASALWSSRTCSQCSHSHTCIHPDHPNASLPISHQVQCLCQSISHYCVITQYGEELTWWNPHNYSVLPITPPVVVQVSEAFGLDELRDKGAITTKTKENLMFLVAALDRETRRNLSYILDDFVLRCSFNGKDCDMDKDFKLHMDPEYGNCYTFNFNDSVTMKNSRAGPMYGLRLLLNVNQSDYMPTTEAAGVRIVVHEQDQEPFPDTFGYSAPTGFISSFGLKTKVLHRLDGPYGKCSDSFRPEGYIYHEHYSPEGCYRNCFQQLVLRECGCGDPRFPLQSEENKTCNAKSKAERACLSNITNTSGGFHHLQTDCACIQPCTENVFETAYSAAAWPSINFKIGTDCPGIFEIFNDSTACTEYYRVNTAYIEIYYEQLNFETLRETAGYTLVNLFSDFGGNIGLWIGFSVITFAEIFELLFEVVTFVLYHKPKQLRARQRQRQEEIRKKRGIPSLIQSHLVTRESHSTRKRTPAKVPLDDIKEFDNEAIEE